MSLSMIEDNMKLLEENWGDIKTKVIIPLWKGKFKSMYENAKMDFNDFESLAAIEITKAMKTQPILLQLLSEKSSNMVGSVSYAGFADKIKGASQGNNADIEEIEFTYLHYLLNDQLILMWSAFGGTGLSKIDALAQMSGVIIAETDMSEYGKVENIIGQLCTGPYLHENYNPLPPL